MTAPITLYYWPTPNGQKIAIALEEMGLAYDLHLINIGAGEQFAPAFLEIAPNNRIPAITDAEGPDGQPISLFESGAILQYLGRKTGQFAGRSAREQAEIEQWLMWQMGGLGPMAGQANHFLRYAPQMDPPEVHPYAQNRYLKETNRLLGVLDAQLAKGDFVVGDAPSLADFAIYPWAASWEAQAQSLDGKPHLAAWLTRMGARPSVQTAMALAKEARPEKLDQTQVANLYKR